MKPTVLSIVFAGVATLASAQETLESVRELYASAEYEGALTALGRLRSESSVVSALELDRYRVLCLFALGRPDEATEVIEGILQRDPLYEPDAAEASPRIRSAFGEARRRLLPVLVRALYVDGKSDYDKKAFAPAAEKLDRTLRLIALHDAADRPELADLRTLAEGFLELARAALPAPDPVAPEPAAPAAAPPATTLAAAPTTVKITDPVVIDQTFPRWTFRMAGGFYERELRGVVEVEIDEAGNVSAAEIVTPIHPAYDLMLVKAARQWKYQPATRNGQPIKVRKRVDVALRPR